MINQLFSESHLYEMNRETCVPQLFVAFAFDMESVVAVLFIFSFILETKANPVSVDENVILRYKPLEHPDYLFGDIVMPKNSNSKGLRNALPIDDFLWPYGTIPVVIHSDLDYQKDLIVSALNHFHEKTCIRFKPRTDETDYLHIIFDEGCYSSIGRTGGQQALSLGYGCHCKGTIIHELMHVLGFYHEQNRSDRDDYVHVVYDKIIKKSRHEFVKLDTNMNRLYSPYDYESIMHYSRDAFSVDGSDTMIPVQPRVVLTHPCLKPGLSEYDILKISKLYMCE